MGKTKNKNSTNIAKIIFIMLFLALIGLIGYNLYIMYKNIEITDTNYEAQRLSFSTNVERNVENKDENIVSTEDMLQEVLQSVVGISKLKDNGGSILNNVSTDDLGLGTGIVVSENGYILSNNHVTGDKYSTCYVTIEENTYKGVVIFSEADLDLSIVKVEANNLKSANLGNSIKNRVGEQVYAIGNPIGYEFKRTVTSGIISALNRTIRIEEGENVSYISDLIQTDATINPGNSGGPLVNKYGEVIGINTVKITSAEGIGFAIPINVIIPVIEQLKNNGKFEEATLGIYAYDSEVAEYMNLKNKFTSGIYITDVITNGPAYKSDLKVGDIIISIDNKKLNTINDLREYIYTKNARDTIILKILRMQKERDIEVILENK